ncbi:hypothetical protein [Haloferula sargassicola]|uniref:Uncharacterized protein n=1 Tax=Haloferula sargassicola TaxID=490096 RepID=A0ABP9UT01_9BACT
MPTADSIPRVRGKLAASTGSRSIALEGAGDRVVIRFNSLATLNEVLQLRALFQRKRYPSRQPVADTPPRVPSLRYPEVIIAIGTRPMAEVSFADGKPRFRPTPWKALTSRI